MVVDLMSSKERVFCLGCLRCLEGLEVREASYQIESHKWASSLAGLRALPFDLSHFPR